MKLVIHIPGDSMRDAVDTALRIEGEGEGDMRIMVVWDAEVPAHLTAETEGVWCEGCAGHPAGLPGVRWPTEANSDSSRDWVERCDACEQYETDEDAANALRAKYGADDITEFGMARPGGSSSLTPYLSIGG